MTTKHFIKKPVVVEVMRFERNADGVANDREIAGWAARYNAQIVGCPLLGEPTWLEIYTLEGTMRAQLGDYIVRGSRDEFWPVCADIFEETYEAAK